MALFVALLRGLIQAVKYTALYAYTAISPGDNHECEHLAADPIGVLE
jgi:hypothetical protein